MKFDPATQLSGKEASELINNIVEHGELILTSHAKERMKQRGYTTQDVIFILTHGEVKASEFDQSTNNWKYKFCGNDISGDAGCVVAAFVQHSRSVVITVLA